MPFEPRFTISIPIASALTAIERTRGFLEAATLSKDWLSKMQARALVLEAHHTTHIEGTHLSLDQSERLISGEKMVGVDSEDVKELLNYRKAFDFVADYVFSQGTITEGLIREIHRRLVEGVRGNAAQPGQYRNIQNYVANSKTKEIIYTARDSRIGSGRVGFASYFSSSLRSLPLAMSLAPAKKSEEPPCHIPILELLSVYTPPAPYDVPVLMAELTDWLQNERTIPPVLAAGIAQFQLVHIHPFVDGNGRTSRLLSTLCLYRSGYDFKKLFTISEYYDRNRQDYYHALQSVRNNNMDMTSWLEYFCKALETQMHEIQLKGSLAMRLDVLVIQHQLSERQKQALESLMTGEKDFNIQEYEALCPGINRRSLQRDMADLIEKGLIVQEGIKKAARYRLSEHAK